MRVKTIGILGAGKLGITLAGLARKAGYDVFIAGSSSPDKIRLSVTVIAPGAVAASREVVVAKSDVVILALPLSKFRTIPADSLKGKLVIDAMNYWWEVDGARETIVPASQTSSQAVQEYFHTAHVVKALSHMSYHDLFDFAAPVGRLHRKAIAIASDNVADGETVAAIVDTLGFDPVLIGGLAAGSLLEPSNPGFGVSVERQSLLGILSKES